MPKIGKKKKTKKGTVHKLDVNRARSRVKKEEKTKSKRRKKKFFTFEPDSRTVIRILPPWSSRAAQEGRVVKLVYTHFNIPVYLKGEKKQKYGNWCTCGMMTDPDIHESCPICEVLDDMGGNVNVKKMRPRGGTFANAVVRGSNEDEDKRVVLKGPVGLYDHIDAQLDDPEIGDISDVKEGYDVIVKRIGKDMDDTEYTYNTRPKSRKLSNDSKEAAEWIKEIVNLDKMFELSDEEMERQEKLAKKLKSYLKNRSDDDLDEDDDDEWDEEEEDDPEIGDDGRPICFGDWKKRNKSKRTTDEKCSECEFEVTCRSRSLKSRLKERTEKNKKKSRR